MPLRAASGLQRTRRRKKSQERSRKRRREGGEHTENDQVEFASVFSVSPAPNNPHVFSHQETLSISPKHHLPHECASPSGGLTPGWQCENPHSQCSEFTLGSGSSFPKDFGPEKPSSSRLLCSRWLFVSREKQWPPQHWESAFSLPPA